MMAIAIETSSQVLVIVAVDDRTEGEILHSVAAALMKYKDLQLQRKLLQVSYLSSMPSSCLVKSSSEVVKTVSDDEAGDVG